MEFKTTIKEIINGVVVDVGEKTIYNADDLPLKEFDFLRDKVKEKRVAIRLKNPIEVNNSNHVVYVKLGSLGYFFCSDSLVYHAAGSKIMSSWIGFQGMSVTEDNFWKCISALSARVNTEVVWYNTCDTYLVPDTNHPVFNTWLTDSLIIALFSGAAYQSSLRQVTYHNSLWDLQNHFFYLSNSQMRSLANQHNNRQLYQDTFTYPADRFVYHQLIQRAGTFSPDAQAVLDKAIDLTIKSFPLRAQADPKFHLNAWDAGWYQIRMGILKEHFKTEYDEFRELLMTLRRRMAPLVYELGFLKE